MTELEKEKLFKLRVQGCDWKYISKELSAPENTLKSYCYRNGLTDNDLAKINECCYCHNYIKGLQEKPLILEKWDTALWITTIRHCIVHRDDSITFIFRDGAEIDIQPAGRTRGIL